MRLISPLDQKCFCLKMPRYPTAPLPIKSRTLADHSRRKTKKRPPMMSMTSPYPRPRLAAIVQAPRGKVISVMTAPIAVIAAKRIRKARVDFVLGATTRNSPAASQTCSGIGN